MTNRSSLLTLAIVVAALSLLAAGCGGGGGGASGVASVASSTTASTTTGQNGPIAQTTLLAFSRCMRSNGLPNFPDPQSYAGGNPKLTIAGYGRDNPQVQAAMEVCGHLLPNRGGTPDTPQQQPTQLADELSFARCMRSHGLSRFPDPTAQAGLTIAMVQAQGIDVKSPAVLRVVQVCLPASHGALTIAKVREAIANAHG